jgi:hypothetical protein
MSTTTDDADLRLLIHRPLSSVAPRMPETAQIEGETADEGRDRGTCERVDVPQAKWPSCLHRFFQVEVS